MGWVRERLTNAGEVRYLALYEDVKGRQRSAGTYLTFDKAEAAWQAAERKIEAGRIADTRKGKQRFERYVLEQWLPHHQMEARTRENYTYYLHRHLFPVFGRMRLIEILPSDVREWVSQMQADGYSPTVIRSCFAILSAIFTTAFNDQLTHLHPCRGVKTPPVPKKRRAILTPEEFDRLHAALPNAVARLFVELDVETGLRWGELAELRPHDLNVNARVLTVARTVVELTPAHHPTGGRFLIKPYPKDQEHRRLTLNPDIVDQLTEHIRIHASQPGDLLFPLGLLLTPDTHDSMDIPVEPVDYGITEPNAQGRTYRHGTTTAYNMAPCRCQHCRKAYADYRARRRGEGLDQPRSPRSPGDPSGHVSRNWFRRTIWQPALKEADIPLTTRPHDLRHAHASWLLAGGADLQKVKDRLGHGTITTTEQYLHTLTTPDDTALTALRAVRNRGKDSRS